MKKNYSITCIFQNTSPTLAQRLRVILESAAKEREPICTLRK